MYAEEQRQYVRHCLERFARFISKADFEASGTLIDVSEGGLSLRAETDAEVGDEIIVYPEGLGRLTGTVCRVFDGGLAVKFDLSDNQRAYLAKRIEAAKTGRPFMRLLENRTHKRVRLQLKSEALEENTGARFDCEIVDLSPTGARIKAERRPSVGDAVRIGVLSGLVRRYTSDGFAIEFAGAVAPAPASVAA
ncbi:MAG: PilZ domain-containing protein [Parvularculaceae bacterium]